MDVILQDRKGGYLWGISAFPDAKQGSFPQEARDMCAKGWDNLIIPTYAGKRTNKIFGCVQAVSMGPVEMAARKQILRWSA